MIEYTLEVICQGRLFFKLYLLSLQYLNFYLKASMVAFGEVPVFFLTGHFISFLTYFSLSSPFQGQFGLSHIFISLGNLTDRGYVSSGSDTHLR